MPKHQSGYLVTESAVAPGTVLDTPESPVEPSDTASSELHRLMLGTEETASHTARQNSRRRLATVAAVTCTGMLALTAMAVAGRSAGLRASAWDGQSRTNTELFEYKFGDQFKAFADKMRGLTGTCFTGTRCDGNAGATRHSCDPSGRCTELPTAFCCQKPESKISTSVDRTGEVTCKCSTTSRIFRKIQKKVKEFEEKPRKVLNRIRAITGQCLAGERVCENAPHRAREGGRTFCCPAGFRRIATRMVGLTATCHCS